MRFLYSLLFISVCICSIDLAYPRKSINKRFPINRNSIVERPRFLVDNDSDNGMVEKTGSKSKKATTIVTHKANDDQEVKETPKTEQSKTTILTTGPETSTLSITSSTDKSKDVDTKSIRPLFEPHHQISKEQFDALCSNKQLNNTVIQTIHRSGDQYILILDDHKLSFRFEANASNKYYPKLTRIPYRCTSYCEKVANKTSSGKEVQFNRFTFNNYLVEFLNFVDDHEFVKFYVENLDFLEDPDQSKHLVEALTFTIEKDGCTLPVTNPQLRENYVDNLITKDLIRMFCNEDLRAKLKKNHFLILEKNDENDRMYKSRHALFLTSPIASAFNLTKDMDKDTKLDQQKLANPLSGIQNAVQIKLNDDRQLFITFSRENMHILQRQETQMVVRSPAYAIQNFYTCPAPLCLDPYYDDIFMVKSCDIDPIFDFVPRASKLFVAFRGNYFYLINKEKVNVPQIENAIPIDYLFHKILNRPDIDFKYIDAAEYVKKSEVAILFKDDKYVLIDIQSKTVHGPFLISDTFVYSSPNPDAVIMDDDLFVMIYPKRLIKYKWSASILSGKKDVVLDEYIGLSSTKNLESIDIRIDAAYKDKDIFYLFVDDDLVEFLPGGAQENSDQHVIIKDSSKFFENCKESSTKQIDMKPKEKEDRRSNLETFYNLLELGKKKQVVQGRQQSASDGTSDGTQSPNPSITPVSAVTSSATSSLNLALSFVIKWLCLGLLFVNLYV